MSLKEWSYYVLWGIVLLQSWILLNLMHRRKKRPIGLAMQDHGLPVGTSFPPFDWQPLKGELPKVAGKAFAVFYSSIGCEPCKALYSVLPAFAKRNPALTIILLVDGNAHEIEEAASMYNLDVSVVEMKDMYREMTGTKLSPFGYYMNGNGVVKAKGVVNSIEQLEMLVS